MATLIHLVGAGELIKLDAALGLREQEVRRVFAFPRAVRWISDVLPEEGSAWDIEVSPLEQLDELLWSFCVGEELMFERQFRPLVHIDKGIWELKTADLRLFGWFAMQDCFIATAINTAAAVKQHRLYGGYRDEAVQLREALDLDEPKFVSGDDPNDVVSGFCYPPRRAASRFVAKVRRQLQKAFADSPDVTQTAVAEALGVNRSVINRQLRGRKDISLGRVAELACALGYEANFELTKPKESQGSNVPQADYVKASVTEMPKPPVTGSSTAAPPTRKLEWTTNL